MMHIVTLNFKGLVEFWRGNFSFTVLWNCLLVWEIFDSVKNHDNTRCSIEAETLQHMWI